MKTGYDSTKSALKQQENTHKGTSADLVHTTPYSIFQLGNLGCLEGGKNGLIEMGSHYKPRYNSNKVTLR